MAALLQYCCVACSRNVDVSLIDCPLYHMIASSIKAGHRFKSGNLGGTIINANPKQKSDISRTFTCYLPIRNTHPKAFPLLPKHSFSTPLPPYKRHQHSSQFQDWQQTHRGKLQSNPRSPSLRFPWNLSRHRPRQRRFRRRWHRLRDSLLRS